MFCRDVVTRRPQQDVRLDVPGQDEPAGRDSVRSPRQGGSGSRQPVDARGRDPPLPTHHVRHAPQHRRLVLGEVVQELHTGAQASQDAGGATDDYGYHCGPSPDSRTSQGHSGVPRPAGL